MISIHQPRMTITISRDHCGLEFLSTRKGMAEGSHEIEQQAKVCITCDLPVDDVKVEFINTPICNFIHDTNIICGVSPPRLQRCGHCSGSQSETLAPYVGQGKMFFSIGPLWIIMHCFDRMTYLGGLPIFCRHQSALPWSEAASVSPSRTPRHHRKFWRAPNRAGWQHAC